jgi:hypothetical protein
MKDYKEEGLALAGMLIVLLRGGALAVPTNPLRWVATGSLSPNSPVRTPPRTMPAG